MEIALFAVLKLLHVYNMYITRKYNLYAMYITYTGIHIYAPKAHTPEFFAILKCMVIIDLPILLAIVYEYTCSFFGYLCHHLTRYTEKHFSNWCRYTHL